MSKDPAFLFYSSDFLSGVSDLTYEERGQYITLLCQQHQKERVTEKMFKMVSASDDVRGKFSQDKDGYFHPRLEEESIKRRKFVESRRQSRLKGDEDQVRIYIVKDNNQNNYKIGSSVNPIRRYNELNNQKNPAKMLDPQGERDLALIWYSEVLPRSTEKEIHEKYSDFRITGEWFELSDNQLKEIFTSYKGEFYNSDKKRTFNRTLPRTENENEIVIEDRIKYLIGVAQSNFVWVASKCRQYGITEPEFEKQVAAWAETKAGDEFKDEQHVRNSFNLFLKNYKEKPNGKFPTSYDKRFDKTLNAQEAQEYRKYLKSLGFVITRPPGQGEVITKPKSK